MWILSRHADIIAALSNWQTYSSARGNLMDELPNRAGATLGTTDPPRHDRMRGLIAARIHAAQPRGAGRSDARALVKATLDELDGARRFDFVGDFSAKVTAKILFRTLGLPPGDDQIVRERAVLMVQSDPRRARRARNTSPPTTG